jgi:outer membrane protein assembly factor BamD (BamD/ComL family)
LSVRDEFFRNSGFFAVALVTALGAGCSSAPSAPEPGAAARPAQGGNDASAAALGDAGGAVFALQRADTAAVPSSSSSAVAAPPAEGSSGAAKALADAGDFAVAGESYEQLATAHARSKEGEDSLFAAAEAFFNAKKHYHALELYNKLLVDYPQTSHYPEALERTFQIGKLFVEESAKKPSWFLGIGLTNREYGIDVLERFVKTHEQHPLAPEALFLVGEAYAQGDQPEVAIESAWKVLVRDYPQSSWARAAEYRIALAFISLSYGVEYDKRPLMTALRRLRAYVRKYPAGDNIQEAEQKLSQLEEELAGHDLKTAKEYAHAAHVPGHGFAMIKAFFSGTPDERRYVSAQIYLDRIRHEYPKTEAAREAARLSGEWPHPTLPEPPDENEKAKESK